ncbi:hypothetical protein [Niveispirillum irakense]|uniref:hypothetical protein n=1 Tax=Niveispirillum irakense TaxID=34011 RepID=UPI000408E44E|nr:hypothetical protein [Niveispirillum irakense]
MSNAIALAADGETLQPGQIRFYQASLPPLPAGTYRLSATQTVGGIKGRDTDPAYQAAMPFQIRGTRFTLAPDDLQMVTPPADQAGAWENTLPNVVLRRPTLPWERTIDGSVPAADRPSTPWIGLIGLTAEELGLEGGDKGASAANIPPPVRTGTVAELVRPGDPTVLGPALTGVSAADGAEPVLLLDIDVALFQAVAPALADLPWLAHVREVNTDRKEILGLTEDGIFSVVVGNRTIRAGTVNYLFLVSLEGHQEHLAGATIPSRHKTIRLASLAWWKVRADAAKGDFIEIMQALPDNGGIDLLRLPHGPIAISPGDHSDPVAVAAMGLDMGYVPLTYRMRVGERTTAWYRGPASAVPTTPDGLGPFAFSDQAIRYDPATALFDVSQAAAWQIGRLLALSDATFARQMFEWRKSHHAAVAANVDLDALMNALPPAARAVRNRPAGTARGSGTLALSRLAATTALADAFAGLAVDPPSVPATDRAQVPPGTIPRRIRREDRLPDTANGANVGGAITRIATMVGQDPLETLLDHIFGLADITE